jgi:hypothetical protein
MSQLTTLIKTASTWEHLRKSVFDTITSSGVKMEGYSDWYTESYNIVIDATLLGGYNKIIISANDIQFHWDPNPIYTKRLLRSLATNSLKRDDLLYKQTLESVVPSVSVEQIEQHIRDIFQTDVLTGTLIDGKTLESHLSDLRQRQFESKPQSDPFDDIPLVLRLEETRDDLTVMLAISPHDFSMKLGIRSATSWYFPTNPLTNFYEAYYSKDSDKNYAKYFRSEHDLQFLEHLGYKSYPDNLKNPNSFISIFGVKDPADEFDLWLRKSGRAQMSFIDQLMARILLFCGPDTKGRSFFSAKTELAIERSPVSDVTVRFYYFSRTFGTPFTDICIVAGVEGGDEDVPPLAMVGSKVIPYAKDIVSTGSCYLHPFIYELSK